MKKSKNQAYLLKCLKIDHFLIFNFLSKILCIIIYTIKKLTGDQIFKNKLTEIEEMEYVSLFWHMKIKTIQKPNQTKTIEY